MALKLYNTLSRKKEVFTPADPKRVTMYNCGPTVYSYAHIGNARAAVVADMLFRVLRHIYGEEHVVYARNITDVDDKIIKAAQEQGVPMAEITEKYAKIYNEDLAALGCLEPTYQPKATDNIKEMQDIIVQLMDKDIAYISQGHILFDVTKMDDYGKLSGRKLDDNLAGARVEVAGYKKNPGDFILWKPAKDGEPGWEFGNHGRGRPGWHIECSAMIRKVLGETIDIHCGGIDLQFPHHENEIAQSECANEKPLANYWVHNEFLNMGKDKMSKSLGNVVLVRDLLKDWDGEVIRLALLKAHYRSELVWSEGLLKESKKQLDRWYHLLQVEWVVDSDVRSRDIEFSDILIDDLDTVEAVVKISEYRNILSHFLEKNPEGKVQYSLISSKLLFSAHLLGLLKKHPGEWFKGNISDEEEAKFDALADARTKARKTKNWAEADRIRDAAKTLGVILEDGADGTTWRRG